MLALVLALQQHVFFGNLHSHTSFSDGSPTHHAVDQIAYSGAAVRQVVAQP